MFFLAVDTCSSVPSLESEIYRISASCPNGTAEGPSPLRGENYVSCGRLYFYVVWNKLDISIITVAVSHF